MQYRSPETTVFVLPGAAVRVLHSWTAHIFCTFTRQVMSRPEKTEMLTLRLTPERLAKAETAAEDEGVSTSEWIRQQIRVGWTQQQLDASHSD